MKTRSKPQRSRNRITVRRARLDDALRIRNLHVRSIRILCRHEYTLRQITAWSGKRTAASFRRAMTAGGEMMFVAEASGRLAGFSSLHGDGIYALYIHPRYARHGVGTRLLAVAERRAARRGVTRVWLDATLTALPFYRARGYRRIRRHAVVRHGVPIPVVRMTKML